MEPSLRVDNDNECKGRKHVQGSEMWQPFGLFSMTYQDFPGSVRSLESTEGNLDIDKKNKLEKVALDGSVECCAPPPQRCNLDL